ncbi:Protein of unknown function (DUF2921) [Abeliophyllum distichum]|uniref:RING-type E3 ubiquitin transferase n=1 Tax=Abeliophyllum distichum TaxID=126358 RepID=A0ABD1QJD3_9LAMI
MVATSRKETCRNNSPNSHPTVRSRNNHAISFRGGYCTGGERILGRKTSNQTNYYAWTYVRFRPTRNYYKTINKGVHKLEASLYFQSPYRYFVNGSNSRYGSNYHRTVRGSGTIKFFLNGFWSEVSRKLCMVGSASWQTEEGRFLNLDGVLKLKFASENPNIFTSLVSGTLESINPPNNLGYFEPILIFDFPYLSEYTYSLASKGVDGGCYDDVGVPKNQSVSLESRDFCSVFYRGIISVELEYSTECKTSQNCTPFDGGRGGYLPKFMFLQVIQCSSDEEKLRYMVGFGNSSYTGFYNQPFDLDSALIGEGSWDVNTNMLCIVACRILNPANHWGYEVGDCTTRLSLRYPSIWTLRNNSKIVGQIWTNKTVSDSGYFRKIMFKSWENDVSGLPGLKYEYTELDRVKKTCPVKKAVKMEGMQYPDGHSYDMRFDMSVKHSKTQVAWGNAVPLFVGNEIYDQSGVFIVDSMESEVGFGTISEADKKTNGPLNISYKLSVNPFPQEKLGGWFLPLNLSMNALGQVEIIAEGMYNAETGHLCMLGCRELSSSIQESINNSMDCEILVNFEFPPMNSTRRGEFIEGSIKSTREKADPLYFEELSMSSSAFYLTEAKQSIWRMDLEITMALISNTLTCILVGLQLFHVKRNPQVLSYISHVMILILSLGHMIPLVLNFEALFLGNHDKQTLLLSTGGWLEANEVTVRIVTMVAFLLQIRLLQLVWTARSNHENKKGLWEGEKKAALVSFPIYIIGGLLTLLLNWTRNRYGYQARYSRSLWGDLRSYAGLMLDGFLLPQILFNVFCSSKESSLSRPFYIGTTLVRVLPHGYDLYRGQNYAMQFVNGSSYYYANPSADFYSTTWDVMIPCVGIVLAVIIFLQQRLGGRWILPQRFRELELYQKVPVVNE